MSINCNLHALSAYVPPEIISNADLTGIVDTTAEWIVDRTGIERRRKLADNQNVSDLALKAAELALQKADLDSTRLTHVVAATCTPDNLAPSVACIVAGKIDAGSVMAFDIGAACTGFIYGLSICGSILASNPESEILFLCAEALTRRLNWTDRNTCVLFGDGAAAAIINSSTQNSLCSMTDVICRSDGALADLITVGGGTSCACQPGDMVDDRFFLSMNGRATYKHAVREMSGICETLLRRNGIDVNDVILVPHQANIRIIEAVGNRLKIDPARVFTNVSEYGNTSAASIPIALAEAVEKGAIKAGDLVLVTAFGAGLTSGAALLRF